MSSGDTSELKSFILLTLGRKRFALPAEDVVELIGPHRAHRFPHTTPLLTGVLLRRGRVVPVCDVAKVLLGPEVPVREYYLIAKRQFGAVSEWAALPVTGECGLISGVPFPSTEEHPSYVSGLLLVGEEVVEVLDLKKVAPTQPETAANAGGIAGEARA